jgi:hypothetical protein
MKRLLGITVLGMLFLINVAFFGVLLLLALFNREALAALSRSLSPGGAGPEMQLKLGRLLPAYYTVAMAAVGVLARGFWRLRRWAWFVVMAIIGLNTVALVFEAQLAWQAHSAAAAGLWLARMILCAIFLWYFCTANIRSAFGVGAAKEGLAHAN